MLRFFLSFTVTISLSASILSAQVVTKEQLYGPVTEFWDAKKTKVESVGYYFLNGKQKTKEKHGKWEYYSERGNLEEVRNYYRDRLMGAVWLYHPNGTLKQEGFFKWDMQDSIYREWNAEAILMVEGSYKSNKPVGKWTYYYSDGRENSVEEIVQDQLFVMEFWREDSLHTQTIINGTGEMTLFHPTGTIRQYFEYKDGLKHGRYYELSLSGRSIESGKYINGKKDSVWTTVYYTGKPQKECTYIEGVLDGTYKTYYDNGKLNVSGSYDKGKKKGLWEWFHEDGTPEMKGDFQNDQQHGDWTYWYTTGAVSYKAQYQMGKKHGDWTYYYQNGKTLRSGKYADDKKDGLWQTFYDNGKLLMKGEYQDDKESGEWLNFWDNGKVKNRSFFKEGQLNGTWNSYYKNGKLNVLGNYKKGFKTGQWFTYFENGKPKDMLTYKVIKYKTGSRKTSMTNRVEYQSQEHGYAVYFSQKDYTKMEEGTFKKGKKNGVWTAYHPGGRIPAITTEYKDGQLHGVMRQFSRQGKVQQEMEFKDGVKHGWLIVYDKRGKAITKKYFLYGKEKKDNARIP